MKIIRKNLIIFYALFVLSNVFMSCDDKEQAMVIDTNFNIYVTDVEGNDLLNPDENYGEKSIDVNKIQIIYLIDGKDVVFYNPMLDYPKGSSLVLPEGNIKEYRLNISLNDKYEKSTTYIKWNDTDTDTIVATISRGDNYAICTGIDINGKNVWNVENSNQNREATIIK